ncbi:hypothetical protein [Helicobacter sp. 13S00477-4]|uniref:hypothetical protein n=1 Tax=Helicobacter sp. 13S00477-4 TaxID=1905759 RepID=UPI000BA60F77|nr:hypothetical protein [Helicobacter sp. 13S00477-4]PAF52531.1 hypothetical protein BKH44_01765 [Helicobacter sp. 13S00477-4]
MKKLLVYLFIISCVFADNWRDLNELHKDLKEADLDHHQEKEVKELFKEYHHELKEWWHENEKIDALAMRSFNKKDFDTKEIEIKMKMITDKKIKIDLKFLKDLHVILNDEQRSKISKEYSEID